jgi:hypothetical protein
MMKPVAATEEKFTEMAIRKINIAVSRIETLKENAPVPRSGMDSGYVEAAV